ncbi:transcription factor fos-like 2 [Elysia marginata]|uniref:Transcription factor fos-like 2 n=1 Tax=Elysia marginata TaxID=1093978 RepID=A0AAV4FGP6_9GAST|nr:transcription factor fos-like 2 [Elysia marginata]
MPPMEPDTEQYCFVPQTSFSNSSISATAPVISEGSLSSPEPVPIFSSGFVGSPLGMFASSRESAALGHVCFEQLQNNSGCKSAGTVFKHDGLGQIKNNNECSVLGADNRNEPIPVHSNFYKNLQKSGENKTCFASQCVGPSRPQSMNHCHHGPLTYRPSGSSSSIGSRSSSNSPGTCRRYSNTSVGKSSISTDEDMSTNPNTPNTPITPLTPTDVCGEPLSKGVTIFNFPATGSNTSTCTEKLTGEYEGLDLDLDLDNDDDVFCTDLSAISSTINSLSSNNNATVDSDVDSIKPSLDIKNHQNLNNINNNNNQNSSFSIKNTSAQPPFPSCPLNHRHKTEKKTGTELISQTSEVSAIGNDPLPALLSDALQVCERAALEGNRDTNNNHSIGSAPDGGSGPSSSPNPALLSAALEAYQSGQITPLLKHELKWVIQLRRLSEGKDEMEVSFDPPAVNQMSDAEMTRAERRRKQNRIAARKFRQKRKSVEEQLIQTIQALKETNSNLEQKAEQLRNEKQALMEFMADHLLVCPCLSQLQLESLAIGDDTSTAS